MNIKQWISVLGVSAVCVLTGCALDPDGTSLDRQADAVVRSSFRAQGMVSLAALDADETNRLCSAAAVRGQALDEETARRIETENFNSIVFPADGKLIGDWRKGEAIAQSGRGLTFSDDPKMPNGGNCYNCHQIDKQEIAFGTIGPSLYNYGKLRGVKDPNSSDSRPMVEYTWRKIWNAKASNACSNMPRAGHTGILTATQIADLMALLLDPHSPVNQ